MEKIYLINFVYADGREKLLLDEAYLGLQSLAAVKDFARKRMARLNGEYTASIVGKIAKYEILAGAKIMEKNSE
ncbi:MAG: hypothetical protein E7517_06695 [Ruminococcaceae bacterium]|nr:hypothetical protein [Oscillospiraceae bacterium]